MTAVFWCITRPEKVTVSRSCALTTNEGANNSAFARVHRAIRCKAESRVRNFMSVLPASESWDHRRVVITDSTMIRRLQTSFAAANWWLHLRKGEGRRWEIFQTAADSITLPARH